MQEPQLIPITITTIFIEKVDNGYIVTENVDDFNHHSQRSCYEIRPKKVFESTENLNTYINENLNLKKTNSK